MADTDQGEAALADVLGGAGFSLVHALNRTEGIGQATAAPTGVFTGAIVPLGARNGPVTVAGGQVLTKNTPVDRGEGSPQAVSDLLMPRWFELVHILPRAKIQFGNIITQQEADYEIYSAFRTTDVTLSSITDEVSPGVALPEQSPPEVVEAQSSMFAAATTDNCSDTLALASIIKLKVQALADGLPVFDGDVVFNFAAANDPVLSLSGQRIVLIPMEYEAPVKETLAFLTDIITALDGDEQRIALRKQPRQLFEVTYALDGNDRQRLQALLMDWTDNVFGFPLWHEKLSLTAATIVGATQYNVAGADDVDLRVGGLAIVFTDSNTFDVLTIISKTDTLITVKDSSLNAYPVGTVLMPIRSARILKGQAGQREQNNLEKFKIVFEVTDNDTGALTGSTAAYSTYNSRVLFDECNVVSGPMAEQFKRRIHRIDNGTGLVAVSSNWDRNKRSAEKGFVLRNRSEIMDFRRLMLSLEGRVKAFYLPTFIEDLEVVANLVIGTSTMDIERIEYERFVKTRMPKTIFRITFTDDSNLVRIIQSVASVDATTERFTLDTTWPANRTVAEIQRVEFYELVRFDADNVVLNYPRIGLAESRMPVVQVFDDNS